VLIKCNICGVSWDPEIQAHNTPQSCIPMLAESIQALRQNLGDLNVEMLRRDEALHEALNKLDKRVTEIAKRVNMLEHPKMANAGVGVKKP